MCSVSTHRSLGWPLRAAMRQIAAEGQGVVVILRYEETPRHLVAEIRRLNDSTVQELPGTPANSTLRTYGTGAQILRKLGVTRMRVLSAPKQMHGISGFGLEVIGYVDDKQ